MTALAALLGGPNSRPRPRRAPAADRPRPLHARTADGTGRTGRGCRRRRLPTAAPRHRTCSRGASAWPTDTARPPLPEERVVRWHADDSRTELVVATDPRRPGRPVLTDAGGEPRTVADGHVPRPDHLPAELERRPARGTPAAHPGGPARLPRRNRPHRLLDTPELLDAVRSCWTTGCSGPRESAALVRVLADAEGLRPAGQVTDRLGRPGQA
ncbi:hypothetical protein LT493_02625 [Streptomyces tricolor]|nr:hypothetical protein [Streptomyces tricolor]